MPLAVVVVVVVVSAERASVARVLDEGGVEM